jgi:hypothetical protein
MGINRDRLDRVCRNCGGGYLVWKPRGEEDAAFWDDILRGHIAAIVGLQAAAALSFALVVFLRQVDGPIEFDGLGFKFKGGAGQVVMWVICFLAITAAIKMSWSMK